MRIGKRCCAIDRRRSVPCAHQAQHSADAGGKPTGSQSGLHSEPIADCAGAATFRFVKGDVTEQPPTRARSRSGRPGCWRRAACRMLAESRRGRKVGRSHSGFSRQRRPDFEGNQNGRFGLLGQKLADGTAVVRMRAGRRRRPMALAALCGLRGGLSMLRARVLRSRTFLWGVVMVMSAARVRIGRRAGVRHRLALPAVTAFIAVPVEQPCGRYGQHVAGQHDRGEPPRAGAKRTHERDCVQDMMQMQYVCRNLWYRCSLRATSAEQGIFRSSRAARQSGAATLQSRAPCGI